MVEEDITKRNIDDVVEPSSTPVPSASKVSFVDGTKDVKSKVDASTKGVKSTVDVGLSSTSKGLP